VLSKPSEDQGNSLSQSQNTQDRRLHANRPPICERDGYIPPSYIPSMELVELTELARKVEGEPCEAQSQNQKQGSRNPTDLQHQGLRAQHLPPQSVLGG